MNNPVLKCGGCGYIFTKTYGYSQHVCKPKIDEVTDRLIDLVLEKHVAEYILDMKYASEHKDKMEKICETIKDMACVVLNTVNEPNIEEPLQTHLIFHERIEANIQLDEAIEHYIFAFQTDELEQYRYINNIVQRKGEIFLNKEEYLGLFDITSMENSNL